MSFNDWFAKSLLKFPREDPKSNFQYSMMSSIVLRDRQNKKTKIVCLSEETFQQFRTNDVDKTTLSLENIAMSTSLFERLADCLEHNTVVDSLLFNGSGVISSDEMPYILRMMQGRKGLRELRIGNSDFSSKCSLKWGADALQTVLSTILSENRRLETLHLGRYAVGDKHTPILVDFLLKHKRLNALYIQSSVFSPYGFKKFLRLGIAKNTTLTTLDCDFPSYWFEKYLKRNEKIQLELVETRKRRKANAEKLFEIVFALQPLDIAPYCLLEIIDYLDDAAWELTHKEKIDIIVNVRNSCEKIK